LNLEKCDSIFLPLNERKGEISFLEGELEYGKPKEF
jgi:hypothetical protein